jgi:hypothetical protein
LKAKIKNVSQSRATKCRWIPVVLCHPCLSLSLLFCLDLCLSRGAASSRPAPTRIGEGGGGSTAPLAWARGARGGLSRREGSFHFSAGLVSFYSPYILFFGGPSAKRAGGGTERAASFGWRALYPSHTHLGSSARRSDSRASAGPAGACPTQRTFLRGQAMSPNSGGLPRQTPGALIVTLLVTVQGTARALKHARAPSRPGKNGGA